MKVVKRLTLLLAAFGKRDEVKGDAPLATEVFTDFLQDVCRGMQVCWFDPESEFDDPIITSNNYLSKVDKLHLNKSLTITDHSEKLYRKKSILKPPFMR